jgi:hypothetical protein
MGPHELHLFWKSKMTDDQINAAIAEACKWTDLAIHPEFGLMGTPPDSHGLRVAVPWYAVDLNAMHEAEKVLRGAEWDTYVDLLAETWIQVAHATARQRAEAFLKTIGKWEDVAR